MKRRPRVSLVIAARNEGANLVDTVACLLETRSPALFEIVVVDDGSNDGSGAAAARQFRDRGDVSVLRLDGVGVAAARNLGARRTVGDILVFMDAHCWCPPGWLEALLAPLNRREVGLVGPAFADLVADGGGVGCGVTWPGPDLEMAWLPPRQDDSRAVPLMPGGCDLVRRELFVTLGGYDVGMGRWGSEGEELSLRVWASGHEVHGVPGCVVRHLFRPRHPYAVDPVEVLCNRLRLAVTHLPGPRLRRVFDCLRDRPGFAEAMVLLCNGDAALRRRQRSALHREQVHSWFARFAIGW